MGPISCGQPCGIGLRNVGAFSMLSAGAAQGRLLSCGHSCPWQCHAGAVMFCSLPTCLRHVGSKMWKHCHFRTNCLGSIWTWNLPKTGNVSSHVLLLLLCSKPRPQIGLCKTPFAMCKRVFSPAHLTDTVKPCLRRLVFEPTIISISRACLHSCD